MLVLTSITILTLKLAITGECMKNASLLSILLALVLMPAAFAGDFVSKSPDNAQLYFISPADGETVTATFTVQFGLKGMGVAPAGVDRDNTGHHHLLIDTDLASLDLGKPLPATDQVKHFGGGQTEAEITLPPGKHTLQLLLGNYVHIPHDTPVVSEQITIIVQ